MQLESKKQPSLNITTDASEEFEELLNFDDDIGSMDDFLANSIHSNIDFLDDMPTLNKRRKQANPQARKNIEDILEAKRLQQKVSDVFEEMV